jgi:hypothetical protein
LGNRIKTLSDSPHISELILLKNAELATTPSVRVIFRAPSSKPPTPNEPFPAGGDKLIGAMTKDHSLFFDNDLLALKRQKGHIYGVLQAVSYS